MKKKDYKKQVSTIKKLSKLSNLTPYINNLDQLLKIKTVNTCNTIIKFNLTCKTLMCSNCPKAYQNTKQLALIDSELIINNKNYDWYIIGKDKDKDLFTIAGINKNEDKQDIVYYTIKRINYRTYLKKEPEPTALMNNLIIGTIAVVGTQLISPE
jgi:hypothetical protein